MAQSGNNATKGYEATGSLSPVPWLAQLGFNIFPWFWVVRDWFSMLAWCRERMKERIQVIRIRLSYATMSRATDILRVLDHRRKARCFKVVNRCIAAN